MMLHRKLLIFVGYKEKTKGWRFFDPKTKKYSIACEAAFFKLQRVKRHEVDIDVSDDQLEELDSDDDASSSSESTATSNNTTEGDDAQVEGNTPADNDTPANTTVEGNAPADNNTPADTTVEIGAETNKNLTTDQSVPQNPNDKTINLPKV